MSPPGVLRVRMLLVACVPLGKTSRESGNKESARGVNFGRAQVEPEGLREELVEYKKRLESLEQMREERQALELERDQVPSALQQTVLPHALDPVPNF